MIGHRTYIDAVGIIRTIAWRPPVPKGHRAWLEPAQGIEARRVETEGFDAKHESPVAKPCAQTAGEVPND